MLKFILLNKIYIYIVFIEKYDFIILKFFLILERRKIGNKFIYL